MIKPNKFDNKSIFTPAFLAKVIVNHYRLILKNLNLSAYFKLFSGDGGHRTAI
jgi:hypothetical protein